MTNPNIVLGICSERNAAAALMIDDRIVGMIQEERLTKRKNQIGFPKRAIDRLVATHLDGAPDRIDRVAYASKISDPYYCALDHYAEFSVVDHVREMHELWYPHFYGDRPNDGAYWQDKVRRGDSPGQDHNYDLSFLTDMAYGAAIDHFNTTVRPQTVRDHYGYDGEIEIIDHHECHAYYALYGAPLTDRQRQDALVLTADSWGDDRNWSASVVAADGSLRQVGSGDDHKVARLYKFATLILGMKPNEHEYKVMGLASYSRSTTHIEAAERIFFEALDFRDGTFVSDRPLTDSYFDLKDRLEGHRFDNVAAALQNWSTVLTRNWVQHWLKETGKRVLCFSGGLSMNIKTNGDLVDLPELDWLSVPASGGDETLCAGACYRDRVNNGPSAPTPLAHVYLGDEVASFDDDWTARLDGTGAVLGDFAVRDSVDAAAAARLLAADCVLARCVGVAEFGARSLGNRSILANPSNPDNVKLINDAIKNRDFWMPFTPSILAEHTDRYLENPKGLDSPFMTIGFASRPDHRKELVGGLHFADYSARPQFVDKATNPDYWALIEAFRTLTGIPAVVNTSLNLHGEPMNYTIADAARTLALSELDFLLLPGDRLLFKRRAEARLDEILARSEAAD